jgi:hypothetical protein
MNRSEFKKSAAGLFRKHVKGGRVQWVWTFVGKYPTGLPCVTGYFVHVKNGNAVLWLAKWNHKYGMEVSEVSAFSWKALSMQNQSVIKGGVGNVPAPEEFGVSA